MDPVYRADPDVHVLPTRLPTPGVGTLVVNAYLILAAHPVLVDTARAVEAAEFEEALRSIIDPGETRWIWLTHDDSDHRGNLRADHALAPAARLVTHGFGALRMAIWWPAPLDRVPALRARATGSTPATGTSAGSGHPSTTARCRPACSREHRRAVHRRRVRRAPADRAAGLRGRARGGLAGGMAAWAAFDSPWTQLVDRARFRAAAGAIAGLRPSTVLSSRLPVASGRSIDRFIDIIAAVPDGEPFIPPDRDAFEAIAAALAAPVGPNRVTRAPRRSDMTTAETNATADPAARPPLTAIHHVGITVTDVATSVRCERVFGFQRLFEERHYRGSDAGYTVVLGQPDASFSMGVDHHPGTAGTASILPVPAWTTCPSRSVPWTRCTRG